MINEQTLRTRVLNRRIQKQRKLPNTPEIDAQLKKLEEESFTLSHWNEDSEPWTEMGSIVRRLPAGTVKMFMIFEIREIHRMIPDDFIDFLEADNMALRNEILDLHGVNMKYLQMCDYQREEIDSLNATVATLKAALEHALGASYKAGEN